MKSRYKILVDFPNKEIADDFLNWWSNRGGDDYYVYRQSDGELPLLEESYDSKSSTIFFEEEEE